MKTSKLICRGIVILMLFVLLSACQPAAAPSSVPMVTFTPPLTAIPSMTDAPTNTPQPASTQIVTGTRQSDGMTMVSIPSGKFRMGSDNGEADEGPAHEVYLDAFWMDATEVTNAMYALCVEAGSCKPPFEKGSYTRLLYFGDERHADYPVIYVDWNMADAYCQWAGAHLPTEAEWEKAARGDDARIFPWGENWDVQNLKRLNFADKNTPETTSDVTLEDGYRDTAPVGSYPSGKSLYGVYDMAGNVWEWVADWYDPSYYRYSPLGNPQGPDGSTQEITRRSLRGGSWVAANENVFHTSNRHGLEPDQFSESVGFRCAR